MIKTPAEKAKVLGELGFTPEVNDWAEYQLLVMAKLAHTDNWQRLLGQVKLLQKTQLAALILNLVIDNQIISSEFVEHINRTIQTNQNKQF